MKRLCLLLLLPLASGALFAQVQYTITGTVPATGTVGVPYSASLALNPLAQAAWSISAGSLPPGLILNPANGSSMAASISGTPTAGGTYSFTVQANIGGEVPTLVTRSYTVVIASAFVPPTVSLPSASLPDGAVGVPYLQNLTASGGYGAGTYTFALTGGALPLGLQLNSPGAIYGMPTAAGSYSFTVQVTSHSNIYPSVTAYGTFSINISPASLTITTSSLPAGTVGVFYSQALAATGGSPPYTWRLTGSTLSVGLTLATSGTFSGTPTTAGSFTYQVIVTDYAGGSASGSFTIKINPAALAITTSSLPAGIVGTAYTATLAATGGIPPYTWSASGLPSGLSISTAGVISGTPTASGSFSVTVQATDSAQATATKAFTISVTAAFTITTAILPNGTVGTPYSQTLIAAGGSGALTWSVSTGALPTGLTLNASTGSLTGTPTAAGTFTFTIKVVDAAGATATKAFSVAMLAGLKITTTSPLPDGVTGVSYSQQFSAGGGLGPYVWNVGGGSLPSGLLFDMAMGILSGTPTTPGTYTFTINVADRSGLSDSATFSITIVAPLSVTAQAPLPGGVVGVAYTQAFAATGGTSPYQWSVSTGAAPTGLSLSATGSLTGTPAAAGTFNFTLQVVDAAGRSATASFTIKINPAALVITTTSLPAGAVGTSYTATTPAATGGTPPFTWSVASGALPGGLSISSAGVISGTPTAAGTFSVTLKVTDSAQATATQSFTITVTAALTITTATLPNATVGTPYSQALTAAGASGTLTWSVSTGALPAGITLNSSTGSLSGTPSAPGTFTFTVSVTGGGQAAAQSFTITVGLPPGPPATITGLPATPAPATQPALGISIPNAYPLDITGQVTLTFAPDSPSPDGQEVVFTTGGRTVNFTVPAKTTQAVFSGVTPGVQTGTVSGTITLTLKLTAAGIDVTPSPAPSSTLHIAKSAPVIVSAAVTRTSGGFNLVVVGYATSREMVSATVGFTAAAGVTLASNQATISLSSVFTTWYQSSASAAYGSQFSLTMPFTFTNGTNPLTSVSVQLTNAQGSSTTANATY